MSEIERESFLEGIGRRLQYPERLEEDQIFKSQDILFMKVSERSVGDD